MEIVSNGYQYKMTKENEMQMNFIMSNKWKRNLQVAN